MLVDLDAERVAHAARELGAHRAAFVAANVADAAQTRKYVAETVALWGKIDVLFSNAGNDGPLSPITDYPEDLFDQIIATHVRGCFLACKYTIPHMNDGGSIIVTSSTVGLKGVPGNCSYVAAKHALMGIVRCVSKEVASRRIRVNSVNPGPVDNPFMRTAEKTLSQVSAVTPANGLTSKFRSAGTLGRKRSRRRYAFLPPIGAAIPQARR